MNSKQNTNERGDDAKKQQPSNLSPSTMEIFDEGIGANNNEQPQRRPQRSLINPNVLANADNRLETYQPEEQVPHQHAMKKKKHRPHQKKKKFGNKNKNKNNNNGIVNGGHNNNWMFNNNNNNIINNSSPTRKNGYNNNNYHHHHYQRSNNNQEYFAYDQQGEMLANQNPPVGFHKSSYIPGNQHTFPVPHPQYLHQQRQQQQQDQQHLFADDGNAKVLLQYYHTANGGGIHEGDLHCAFNEDNGNSNSNVNETQSTIGLQQQPTSCKWWVGMIDNDTTVQGVVLFRGGQSQIVPIPPKVGACLARELLVQKENVNTSTTSNPHNGSETTESTQGRHVHTNTGTQQGLGDQGNATAVSLAQAPVFQEHGISSYTMMATPPRHPYPRSYPHPFANGYCDRHLQYGMMPLNQQQPYNGGGSFPTPGDNNIVGMQMASPPPPYHPAMMQQQLPYTAHASYIPQYPAQMAPIAGVQPSNGCAVPGYARPHDLHADANHNGPDDAASTTPMNREAYASGNPQRRDNEDHQANNNGRSETEATPNRGDVVRVNAAEGGNEDALNRDAMTPHRGPMGAGSNEDEGDARRVSFSPMVPSSHYPPATASNGKN